LGYSQGAYFAFAAGLVAPRRFHGIALQQGASPSLAEQTARLAAKAPAQFRVAMVVGAPPRRDRDQHEEPPHTEHFFMPDFVSQMIRFLRATE
jgi:pimeloyl-ACP methyl ester carboxylesterase